MEYNNKIFGNIDAFVKSINGNLIPINFDFKTNQKQEPLKHNKQLQFYNQLKKQAKEK